jgi:hypothetical protein
MPSIENIVGNYINSERRFRSAVKKFAHSIIKEFNSNLDMNFRVKDIDVNVDGIINIIITIGNNDYNFALAVYYMPMENKAILYRMHDAGFGDHIELGLSDNPSEIAIQILAFIDPADIVKTKLSL